MPNAPIKAFSAQAPRHNSVVNAAPINSQPASQAVATTDGPRTANAIAPTAQGPVQRSIDNNQTVAGQMNSLLDQNSDYMQINQQQARRRMNSRGMDDTSVGQGAISEAAIKSALPIAQQDAAVYGQADRDNFQVSNDFINSENNFGRTRYLQDDNQAFSRDMQDDTQAFNRDMQDDSQAHQDANREDTQNYGTSERLGQQDYKTAERLGIQDFTSSERRDVQDYQDQNREDIQAYGTSEREGQQDFQNQNREDTQLYNTSERQDVQNYQNQNREDIQSFENQNREDTQAYNDSNREDMQQFEATQLEGVQQHDLDRLNDQQAHELRQADEAMADYREQAMVDMDSQLREQYLATSAQLQAGVNQQITAIYSNPNMTAAQQDAAVASVRANGTNTQEWLTESVGVLNDFDVDLGGLNVEGLLLAGNSDFNGGGLAAANEWEEVESGELNNGGGSVANPSGSGDNGSSAPTSGTPGTGTSSGIQEISGPSTGPSTNATPTGNASSDGGQISSNSNNMAAKDNAAKEMKTDKNALEQEIMTLEKTLKPIPKELTGKARGKSLQDIAKVKKSNQKIQDEIDGIQGQADTMGATLQDTYREIADHELANRVDPDRLSKRDQAKANQSEIDFTGILPGSNQADNDARRQAQHTARPVNAQPQANGDQADARAAQQAQQKTQKRRKYSSYF